MIPKHSRLRVVGRWAIRVWFVLMLLAIPVSMVVRPEVVLQRNTRGPAYDILDTYTIKLEGGQIAIDSVRVSMSTADDFPARISYIPVGWSVGGHAHLNAPSWRDALEGLLVPWEYSTPPRSVYASWGVSLLYPAMIVGGCLWLLNKEELRRKRVRTGHCISCGYSLAGIDGAVCPECGGERDA